MIAFNRSNNNNDNDFDEKLQGLINYINNYNLDDFLEEEIDDTNISELIEIVYMYLFTQNYSEIDLSIKKKSNNAIHIKINNLKWKTQKNT